MIMRSLGGIDEVAEWVGVPPTTARAWSTAGIPRKHHAVIMMLARRKRLGNKVTIEKLQETNAFGKAWRQGRIGRKASTLPPSPSTILRRRRAAAAATTPSPLED